MLTDCVWLKPCRKNFARNIAVAVFFALVSILWAPSVYAKAVKIATTPSGHLIWIAKNNGYFKDAGVDVEVVRFSSGVAASKALLAGEIDIATSSEFAFVSNVMRHPQLRILAGIARASAVRLFTRKDSGISMARDLVGKRVGLTRQSIGEFFLGEHLLINGIGLQEIELVDLAAPDIKDALATGAVDAAITWQPFVNQNKKSLGANYLELPEQEAYFYHFLMVAQRGWVDANQRAIRQVLTALIRAEAFVRENTLEAQKLLAVRLQLDLASVQDLWDSYVREVILDQTLLGLMEQEAHWRVENGLAESSAIPNFLDVIDAEPLRAVKPSAVRFIR